MDNLEQLRYPVGRVQIPDTISEDQIQGWIANIEVFPRRVEDEVQGLTDEQLKRRYRPDGWTIHQVVNHCADSHTNSIIRFKWALTEDHPTIKAYQEAKWAELDDTTQLPVEDGVALLKSLHKRWVFLLKSLTPEQLERTYVHPEKGQTFNLKQTICQYDWHCRHHLQHIKNAKENGF